MSYDTDRYIFYHTQSTALSLTECGIQICHAGHAAPPAKYPHHSMHFILEGKGFYEIGGKRYDLSAGEGFLIKPGDVCTYTADEKEPWKYVYISFRGTQAQELADRIGLAEKCTFAFDNSEEMQKTIYRLHACGKEDAHGGLDALGLFLFIMGGMTPKKQARENKTEAHHLMRAKSYMEDNFAYEIRISDVALYACLERSYLYRLFMRYENCSPMEYLTALRLSHAAELLRKTSLSTAEIAAAVGFFDASHFSKAFAKKYGVSPGEYRKKRLDKNAD